MPSNADHPLFRARSGAAEGERLTRDPEFREKDGKTYTSVYVKDRRYTVIGKAGDDDLAYRAGRWLSKGDTVNVSGAPDDVSGIVIVKGKLKTGTL